MPSFAEKQFKQELGAGVALQHKAKLVVGLHQLVHQSGGGDEADRPLPLTRRQSQAQGDVGLARSTGPRAMTFSRRSIHSQRAILKRSGL